jgi:hypothetical protein
MAAPAAAAAGPAITSMSPTSLAAGSPPATVDVYGSGFDSTCQVQADTVPRTTFFLDPGHLQFTARPDVETGPSSHEITVVDSAGNVSNAVVLTFTGPQGAATPTIAFYHCDNCGISVATAAQPTTAPVCVCGVVMAVQAGKVPVVLTSVVWRDPPKPPPS